MRSSLIAQAIEKQNEFREAVEHGFLVPLWGTHDFPEFAIKWQWRGQGIVLSMEELEELFEHELRVWNAVWN